MDAMVAAPDGGEMEDDARSDITGLAEEDRIDTILPGPEEYYIGDGTNSSDDDEDLIGEMEEHQLGVELGMVRTALTEQLEERSASLIAPSFASSKTAMRSCVFRRASLPRCFPRLSAQLSCKKCAAKGCHSARGARRLRAQAPLCVIWEEPQRGGRLRERVSAVREQLPGTRLNLGCRLNLHKFSLHGLQPGVLMSGHLGV